MAADTHNLKFKIDDVEYDWPMLDDLDMDEWEILYEYTGLILDDFAPKEDEAEEKDRERRIGQSGFIKAILHIGYQRANPELKPDAVKRVIGKAKLTRVLTDMAESVPEEDETPLASTTEPEPSSKRRPVDSKETTSPPSPKSSDEQDAPPVPTGTAA